MTKRIFRSILGVSLAVLLASLVLIVGVLHGYFQDRVSGELESLAEYIAHGVEENGTDYLTEDLPGSYRITWVDADGTVLFDNRQDPEEMGNHAQREEIREALILGKGHAVRYSDTLSQQTLYAAQRLADGTVLRVSSAQYSVWVLVLQALQPVALMMLLAFILAMALASRVARQLVEPINAIDLNDPAGSETYEELTPLLSKLRSQQRQIQRQMRDLKRRQEEFTAITENMSEGFLVIDQETRVLTYNSAVLRLLYAQVPTEEGESVYALNREAGFRRCVEEALAGRRCEQLLEKDDDCRQIIASPVEQDGQIAGAVLVILDVTEKEQRERLRREFTANVSHELKTPLTSILGTAEILQNGLVKPEDVPHFAGNIHRETERLIGLVNDIIKLSRLDEGGGLGRPGAAGSGGPAETGDHPAPGRRGSGAGRAPDRGGDRLQPLRQRHRLQPGERQRHRHSGKYRLRPSDHGGGYWHRHSPGGPGPGIRAVLPGGQEPFLRRHGTGALHRQARGGLSGCPGGAPQRTGPRQHLYAYLSEGGSMRGACNPGGSVLG